MVKADMQFSEQDIDRLFSLPQVSVDFLEACLKGAGASELAEIVQQDTSLAARILRVASKTCPEQLDAAEPLTSAIRGLGLPVVKGIGLQAAKCLIGSDFSSEELRFLSGLWFSSRVSGQSASCLAASVSYPHVEEAQLTGVLLNLGMHILFVRNRRQYVELAEKPLSCSRLRRIEDEHYQTDHLRIAERLIRGWRVDSFLVDAVRFLHVDPEQIEYSGQLLKIARLSHRFSSEPVALSGGTMALAKRLFQFRDSEVEHLFDWAKSLYGQHLPAFDDSERLQREVAESLKRLTELIFGLAEQGSARARLGCSNVPEDLAKVVRNLYLENSSASETIFFLVEQKSSRLVGLPAEGQPQSIRELSIPLVATASLVSEALLKGTPLDSLNRAGPISVSDHLLLRLCRSKGFYCQPFCCDSKLFGVAVIGVDSPPDVQFLRSLRLQMYAQVITEALEQMTTSSLASLGESTSLLRRVYHEVSDPLTIIGNYAEVLRHMLAGDDNSSLVESIKCEVRRVDDVLSYYLNQQELPRFPEQRISLNQLVRDSVETLRMAEIEPRGIEVRLDLQDGLEKVAANAVLIKQILVNLIKNAAEAIDDNGMITLATRDSFCAGNGRYAEIVVEDNGPGVAAEIQKKLFQPVVSPKGPGHAGVGLSIVKTMVDDLGARISCHSSPTAGTSFSLQVPCGDSPATATARPGGET